MVCEDYDDQEWPSIDVGGSLDAVIHDWDKTTVNSGPMVMEFMRLACATFDRQFPFQTYQEFKSGLLQPFTRTYTEVLGIDWETNQSRLNEMFVPFMMGQRFEVFEGISQLYWGVKDLGLKQAIGSSNEEILINAKLKEFGLDSRVDVVVGYRKHIPLKPNPDLLLLVARELKVDPSRCLYVGDELGDAKSARAAGMKIALATWDCHDKNALADESPDFLAESPLDVLKYIQSMVPHRSLSREFYD